MIIAITIVGFLIIEEGGLTLLKLDGKRALLLFLGLRLSGLLRLLSSFRLGLYGSKDVMLDGQSLLGLCGVILVWDRV